MGAEPILVCCNCKSTCEIGHFSSIIEDLDRLIKTRKWQPELEFIVEWEEIKEWFEEHKDHDIWYDPRW